MEKIIQKAKNFKIIPDNFISSGAFDLISVNQDFIEAKLILADEKDFDEMDDFDYFGWINEVGMHESWSYRTSELARILWDCGWADIYNHY